MDTSAKADPVLLQDTCQKILKNPTKQPFGHLAKERKQNTVLEVVEERHFPADLRKTLAIHHLGCSCFCV